MHTKLWIKPIATNIVNSKIRTTYVTISAEKICVNVLRHIPVTDKTKPQYPISMVIQNVNIYFHTSSYQFALGL